MIRNLTHAAVCAALILVTGWVVNQPSVVRQMAAHPGSRFAVLGLIVTLALIAVVSVASAFRPKKKKSSPGSSYATANRR
jgi:hypothetical protein